MDNKSTAFTQETLDKPFLTKETKLQQTASTRHSDSDKDSLDTIDFPSEAAVFEYYQQDKENN